MLSKARVFRKTTNGMAAVEFALIAPVLATMLLGTMEICNALDCHQKVTMVASSAADLVAQASAVSTSQMTDIFAAATAIVYPFPQNNITIVVSSVLSDGAGNGKVAWSRAQNGTALAANSVVNLGQPIMSTCDASGNCTPCAVNACSVIYTQVRYGYISPIGRYLVGTVTMSDFFFERPRKGATIAAPT